MVLLHWSIIHSKTDHQSHYLLIAERQVKEQLLASILESHNHCLAGDQTHNLLPEGRRYRNWAIQTEISVISLWEKEMVCEYMTFYSTSSIKTCGIMTFYWKFPLNFTAYFSRITPFMQVQPWNPAKFNWKSSSTGLPAAFHWVFLIHWNVFVEFSSNGIHWISSEFFLNPIVAFSVEYLSCHFFTWGRSNLSQQFFSHVKTWTFTCPDWLMN